MRNALIVLFTLVGCATQAPPPKPLMMLAVGNCWYQKADVYDWKCELDPDRKRLTFATKNGLEASYDEDTKVTCWKYKVSEGEWEARCQIDQMERYKREKCSFKRMSAGVVAVACP